LPHYRTMPNPFRHALLAGLCLALVLPLWGQQTAAGKRPKKIAKHSVTGTRGEAASLQSEAGESEARDMREDNRGRLTSASRHASAYSTSPLSGAVYHGNTAATPRTKAASHAAASQQGRSGQASNSHIHAREKALRRPIHSDAEADKQAPDASDPGVHLKKHNARMF